MEDEDDDPKSNNSINKSKKEDAKKLLAKKLKSSFKTNDDSDDDDDKMSVLSSIYIDDKSDKFSLSQSRFKANLLSRSYYSLSMSKWLKCFLDQDVSKSKRVFRRVVLTII